MLLTLQWLAAVFGSHVIWRGVRVSVANPEAETPRAVARQPAVEGPDGR
jgi:ceramide glucosyltransferase